MPHNDRQRRPRTAGTVALLAASALLACIGITLLAHGTSNGGSAAAPAPVNPAPSTNAPTRTVTTPAPSGKGAPTPSASVSGAATATASTTPVPDVIDDASRRFVLAWTGHDARPGKDHSYDDAARRATVYTSHDLAEQLSTSSAGTARQWKAWTEAKARVTAEITRLAVPDGAPAPTADTAWIRVRYRLTVTPAIGRPSATDEQVALKLQRDQAGSWLVTALPNA
ncbi:hypothetical protein [Streptomyces sp. RKAG337]|uniref:hypothetical protein n=1 Tax=Streptomyces sp. RKAG337 TaxID=2893404 RepID=UPI00203430B0|nr:hypothetical protein [Streptomyces sp. RKAG337]MCM2430891.1 hypothetical protein [Streptomyces sp. RKAG337]